MPSPSDIVRVRTSLEAKVWISNEIRRAEKKDKENSLQVAPPDSEFRVATPKIVRNLPFTPIPRFDAEIRTMEKRQADMQRKYLDLLKVNHALANYMEKHPQL